jgi:hypothetical protein
VCLTFALQHGSKLPKQMTEANGRSISLGKLTWYRRKPAHCYRLAEFKPMLLSGMRQQQPARQWRYFAVQNISSYLFFFMWQADYSRDRLVEASWRTSLAICPSSKEAARSFNEGQEVYHGNIILSLPYRRLPRTMLRWTERSSAVDGSRVEAPNWWWTNETKHLYKMILTDLESCKVEETWTNPAVSFCLDLLRNRLLLASFNGNSRSAPASVCSWWINASSQTIYIHIYIYIYIYIYIWVNCKDLTATSLQSWLVRGNIPKIAFFQVSEL